MNNWRKVVLIFVMCVCFIGCAREMEMSQKSDQQDWRLGVQAYTFKEFTLYEAIEKTSSLGLGFIEAYIFAPERGQKLSKERPDVIFHYEMSAELKEEVKRKLKEAGVRIVNFYIARLPAEEAECRKVFDFVKEMGAETIVSEPPAELFDMIEKLCKEYEIKLAVHNHPKSSPWMRYWSPEEVSEVCKGRSEWIGVCADTGHWVRSGVNPVEGLKKLEGRIITLHLKDLNEFGNPEAHDVIWGSGVADVKGILGELKRQGFSGAILVEYEHNWMNSVPDIRECVEYFKKAAGELEMKVK